jgi:hypothetical protein
MRTRRPVPARAPALWRLLAAPQPPLPLFLLLPLLPLMLLLLLVVWLLSQRWTPMRVRG